MAPVPSAFVWEVTKGLKWEIMALGSIQLTLSQNTLVPVLGVLRQHGFGEEGVRRAQSRIRGHQGRAVSSCPLSMSSSCCLSALTHQ